jgi:hypothetical protein
MRIWLRANDDDSEEVEVRPLKDSLFEGCSTYISPTGRRSTR